MGGKGSKEKKAAGSTAEEKTGDREIEAKLRAEASKAPTLCMLLLGTGGSGKSTVFKQMERMHGVLPIVLPDDVALEESSSTAEGVTIGLTTDSEEKSHSGPPRETVAQVTDSIHRHIIEDIHDLCLYCVERLIAGDKKMSSVEFLDAEVMQTVAKLGSASDWALDKKLTPTLAELIAKLWAEPGVKCVFAMRSLSHVMDCSKFFLDRVVEIGSADFQPTFTDYIKVRQRTAGIITSRLRIAGGDHKWMATITDVGGQMNERKKWTAAFGGIDVVIWLFSLSGYDQVLFENNDINVYDDNWTQFSAVCHRKEFGETDFVVFLNKYDVFVEKLAAVPYSVYDDEITGDAAKKPAEVIKRVTSGFKKIWTDGLTEEQKRKRSKSIFFHTTCATDTKQMKKVLWDLQASMVRRRLLQSGLAV